jgi:hypothetical protein
MIKMTFSDGNYAIVEGLVNGINDNWLPELYFLKAGEDKSVVFFGKVKKKHVVGGWTDCCDDDLKGMFYECVKIEIVPAPF